MNSHLVLMAAGLGSRFGGTKQLAEVEQNGESLLDFTIQDAARAGIDTVVVIVRSEIADDMRAHLEGFHKSSINFKFVLQDRYGPSRQKPWGTTHAVVSAAEAITGPFVLANADDYYGFSSIQAATEQLRNLEENTGSLITFELSKTLSSSGSVTRGICSVENGLLSHIVETEGLLLDDSTGMVSADKGRIFNPGDPVSMNLWCFHPSILSSLQIQWESFYANNKYSDTAECLLPVSIANLMEESEYQVTTIPSKDEWTGLTNPDDLKLVREKFSRVR